MDALFRPFRAKNLIDTIPRAAATLAALALPCPGLICAGPFGAQERANAITAVFSNLIRVSLRDPRAGQESGERSQGSEDLNIERLTFNVQRRGLRKVLRRTIYAPSC